MRIAFANIETVQNDRRTNSQKYRFGFKSQAEIDNAKLGEAFQIFTVDSAQLTQDVSSQDFHSLAAPRDTWQFLILVDGEAKALLTVAFFNGDWRAVEFGASLLAKELIGLLATWPKSSGHQHRLIKVFAAGADIIEISRNSKVIGNIDIRRLTRKPGRTVGFFDDNDLLDSAEILSDMRSAVKQGPRD